MRAIRSGFAALPHLFSGAWPLHRIMSVVDRLWGWRRRHRVRRHLMMMSDHMCNDIGISRADAWREGRKPFWKA